MNPRTQHVFDSINGKKANILEFEKKEIVCVDVNRIAEDLSEHIDECLEYEGLDSSDIDYVDYDLLKLEIAKVWIEKYSKKD